MSFSYRVPRSFPSLHNTKQFGNVEQMKEAVRSLHKFLNEREAIGLTILDKSRSGIRTIPCIGCIRSTSSRTPALLVTGVPSFSFQFHHEAD